VGSKLRVFSIISALLSAAILAGCTPVKSGVNTTSNQQNPIYEPGQLNSESLLDILSAELYGQNHDFESSYTLYFKQAQLNRSAELAERATRIAQFIRSTPKVIEAAELWQKLATENTLPGQILLNIYLHEQRYDEAFALLEKRASLTDETLNLLDSHRATMTEKGLLTTLDYLSAKPAVDQVESTLLKARIERQLNKLAEAVKTLNNGLELAPNNPNLMLDKARIIGFELDQKEESLKLTRAALKANPDHRELRAFEIRLMLELEPQKVEKRVDQAIKTANQDPQLIYYYSVLMLENSQPTLSLKWTNLLLEQDPERKELLLYRGIAKQQLNDKVGALADFASVPSGDALINAFTRTSQLLESSDDADDLLARMNAAILKDPERIETLVHIASDWLIEKDLRSRAIDLLDTQLKAVPGSTSLIYALAMAYDGIDTDKMLNTFEKALALDPENPSLQNAYGYTLLIHSTRFNEAFELIKSALKAQPNDAATIDSYGWALFKLERFDEAITYLQRAFDEHPDPEVAGHLIQALAASGEKEKAVELLQKMEQQHPDNKFLIEAKEWLGI
jgi:tetratricopeptide (TPR) repeat protein